MIVKSVQNNNIVLEGVVPPTFFNRRLDQCLSEMFPDFSRSKIKYWIELGAVTVDGSKIDLAKTKVKGYERICIQVVQEIQTENIAQSIPLNIVYEDTQLIIVNKPAGLVVHPGAGNKDCTLLNALLAHAQELRQLPRAGIVHRLDKDTTGLMVVAKTLQAQTSLVAQLQTRQMGREYEAIVLGQLIAGGSIDEPIARHPTKRTLMAVRHTGKEAITHYRVICKYRQHTHLRLKLETGRTHQIRVHMAHLKYPLVGDNQYSGRPKLPKGASDEFLTLLRGFNRQALHAIQLSLIHPEQKREMTWQAPLPVDMQNLLDVLADDARVNKSS